MSSSILHDGARLSFDESVPQQPAGHAFIFQHGMGGDTSQPLGYLAGEAPTRVLAVDARGHGKSSDIQAGDARFDILTDDVIAVADSLRVERFVIGGISLGAGTAINVSVRYPERVSALVLCRPAWLDQPQDVWNREVYNTIADLLETCANAGSALEQFTSTAAYQQVLATSPDAAESLCHQITRPRAAANATVLRSFPADRPTSSAASWADVAVPTLVIGHHDDPFHPFAIAEAYARIIPAADLITVPSKDADSAQFFSQVRAAINDFLSRFAVRP
ncbi:MAG: hypothetical protein DLM67_19590 [Candidatus Nephthysia bennettiae]|uniref:Alpha/beta fold hydrolase n=1 Tax=Candidatus Nephthysia bennettiae TaxID=3127016 RepID=A0A934K347_9BACT|nr:alpha/beta fold hydrolase [Candidatus Dormibacteraeota bacterium]MBJ7611848.1 alpha/beta fold hydrolase [Candidatus Dormibacteraeota bacterium]PZR88959.1 MAG: hypothetical protein DLM67_19590 [Candidatus Dormibacteraeota bacterium]